MLSQRIVLGRRHAVRSHRPAGPVEVAWPAPERFSSAPYGSAYASHRSPSLTWLRAATTSGPTLAVSRPLGVSAGPRP